MAVTATVVSQAQSPTVDDFDPGADNPVNSMVVQPDGKIVVGGSFKILAGQARSRIGRLNSDGTLDPAFNPGADDELTALAIQPDGKILVGGSFAILGGHARSRIGRLNGDGSLDATFDPGANHSIASLLVQPDGKVLVGGAFTTLAGEARSRIGRLNNDGTLDPTFNPDANNFVMCLAVQDDGKILVGGRFTAINGQPRNHIARLNRDGSLDTNFDPGANSDVYILAVQADGKILVCGSFSMLGGQTCSGFGRLDRDGTLDATFDPRAGGDVYAVAVQADGKIQVGGGFLTLGGRVRQYIGRLNRDGTLDTSFNPAASSTVLSLTLQADGKALIGGHFTELGGRKRNRIGRLNSAGQASQSLSYEDSTITWLRGGTSPEIWRTSFEVSTNSADWFGLGAGSRISDGWRLTGVSVSTNANVRARGFVAGGRYTASGWFVQSILGPPVVVSQPVSCTNIAGTVARFGISVGGSPPLAYQWLKGKTLLTDSDTLSGTQTSTLTISNVLGADAGEYSVIVSNSLGSVTNEGAVTLTVVDPYITNQPVSQNAAVRDTVSFDLMAVGTVPLHHQWRKDGVVLGGATGASLILTNVQGTDAGVYDVMVSNSFGNVTSEGALLTVNLATADSGFDPGASDDVFALAVQADDKILVGGRFWTLGGQSRHNLGRLHADGRVDTTLNPGANGDVYALAIGDGGKIVVGGYFTLLGGEEHKYIGRLNSDGTLDTKFDPDANGAVRSLALQADGKIVLGGGFRWVNGERRNCIARLNSNGTLDTLFNPDANGTVHSLVLQPDGKILLGGDFTELGGKTRKHLARLNPDGTVDPDFDAEANSSVYTLAQQADGKILLGGYFTRLAGQLRDRIGRLNRDGTIDVNFDPGAEGSPYVYVYTLAVQTDGKILVGGNFRILAGQLRDRIGRLNSDGTVDASFNPGADGDPYLSVYALALQADGRILAGGEFDSLGGEAHSRIGRINHTGPAIQSLSSDSSRIRWLRSGTSPEVFRASFDASTNNGIDWFNLGEGTRINGGWQLDGDPAPNAANIRARGFVSGGWHNSSSWFVESIIGPPVVVSHPVSRTNDAGTEARFDVAAGGTAPLGYQWLKDQTLLSNGSTVSGAQTSSLRISDVLGEDAGGYSVLISNMFGMVTSRVATLTVVDPLITSQPRGWNVDMGDTVVFSVTAVGTALDYQWRRAGVALAGAKSDSLILTNVQGIQAGDYDVVVSSSFGSVTSEVAVLAVNLATVDPGFYLEANGQVNALALQPDGRIVVGGSFNNLGGETRYTLARLNSDGSLDDSFDPGGNDSVFSLAVQPDGKILVGGFFATLGGQPRSRIGRLNSDGTLDTTFNPGANREVISLVLQPDGKILVGGGFSTLGGENRDKIGRLNNDGTLDSSFDPGANGSVYCLAVQPDGKILVGGGFSSLGGEARDKIARLNTDGTLDTSFDPGADGTVLSLVVQADGKILVGGSFSILGGGTRSYLGRLNGDGTLDTTFNPGANSQVGCVALQVGGKILVGGYFTYLAGEPRLRIARLNNDGTLDSSFNPTANGGVFSLVTETSGKVWAAGPFTTLGGQTRKNIGRLNATSPATQSLSSDGSCITWLRGGTSPEIWRATFEVSTNNGGNWLDAGEAVRIDGGWQACNVSVPANANLRARGFGAGGRFNNSSWLLENIIGPPVFATQPVNRTNDAETVTTFVVEANGTPPLSYQWVKDQTILIDGGTVSGAQTPSLTISNVFGSDAGGYSVIISNTFGSVTSRVAILTVVDPLISTQPSNQVVNVGGTVELSVSAVGTMPLGYQWRKDGAALVGATTASLSLTNVQTADTGSYDVVVSNTFSTVTSAVALLSVNLATVDPDFDPGAYGTVYSLALQPDGKILVGGNFTRLAKGYRNNLGRLNTEGTLDNGFDPSPNGWVGCLALQPDGKILVGGNFTGLAGQTRLNIGRLNRDGTLDTAFNAKANDNVYCIAIQPDGRILVGGWFEYLNGQPRNHIGRLNRDGTLDTTFHPSASGIVDALALQPDGKVLVGGNFNRLEGFGPHIARLNSDGTPDAGFDPGANGRVESLVLQPDGRILVGGSFTILGGESRNYIARLSRDGTLDASFNPDANSPVSCMTMQADGSILACGYFTVLAGQARQYIGRLNGDGTLDTTFNPVANSYVFALAGQPDGNILVGGHFTTLAGAERRCVARLHNTGPATQTLSSDGSTITWSRGGTGPEVWRTTVEASTNNGADWFSLGEGTPISGGWRLAGISLGANANIRARGFTTGGYQNGSSWFVQSTVLTTAPLILEQPPNQTKNVGTAVTMSVVAEGMPPLSYQWRKDGTVIVGATNAALHLTDIQESDQGLYSVIVGNPFGSVTSSAALLVVNQPPIADASATLPLWISPNGVDASVVLDGSRSSDLDGDPLMYAWYSMLDARYSMLDTGMVAVAVLPVGTHTIDLVVNDGLAQDTNTVTVAVLSTAQALERLITRVNESGLRHKQPLLESLKTARASIERGNCRSAAGQLGAFQNKVQAQVSDPFLATELTGVAGQVIAALDCEGLSRVAAKIRSLKRQHNGKLQLSIEGSVGKVHILQASTNLVDWETICVLRPDAEGNCEFNDTRASTHPSRFYRVVEP